VGDAFDLLINTFGKNKFFIEIEIGTPHANTKTNKKEKKIKKANLIIFKEVLLLKTWVAVCHPNIFCQKRYLARKSKGSSKFTLKYYL